MMILITPKAAETVVAAAMAVLTQVAVQFAAATALIAPIIPEVALVQVAEQVAAATALIAPIIPEIAQVQVAEQVAAATALIAPIVPEVALVQVAVAIAARIVMLNVKMIVKMNVRQHVIHFAVRVVGPTVIIHAVHFVTVDASMGVEI